MAVHAEISVIPITKSSSMSEQVAAAFDAISRTAGIRATLTPLGTQMEATGIDAVLNAIRAAHDATQAAGATRIISSIRIDQRLDKDQTLEDKVRSVNSRLGR
ncbi:MAG: MTH1187 family thiamine-binding protein [Nitrososphaera sp.]|jgi:uncharacterized protein (TIGR00106 family)